jgi:hypothetical protein
MVSHHMAILTNSKLISTNRVVGSQRTKEQKIIQIYCKVNQGIRDMTATLHTVSQMTIVSIA